MHKLVYMFSTQEAPRYWRPMWSKHVGTEYYDPDKIYDPDTVFYYDMYGPFHSMIDAQLAQGYKIIFDAKNEHYLAPSMYWIVQSFKKHPGQGLFIISGHTPQSILGVQVVATPYWYWIIDHTNFVELQYNTRPKHPTHEHKFFMQMSLQRVDREMLYNQLTPVLPYSLHSYRAHGVHLPNDVDPTQVHNWQRCINWDWINSCSITLVVESCLDDHQITGISLTQNNNRFICEKTYKPIAYGHAFLLASTQHNLAHVREQGFETFPELWDESYDALPVYTDRAAAIIDIIKDFDHASLEQPIVQQKIAHNQSRFFDPEIRQHLTQTTIINPVLEFVHG